MLHTGTQVIMGLMCVVALGCGGENERESSAQSTTSASETAPLPGAESGGVSASDGATGEESGNEGQTASPEGLDAEALRRCLDSLEGSIPYDVIDDSKLQRRLLAGGGGQAYAIRAETEDDKQAKFSVYIFPSTDEAQAEHKRRLKKLEDEFLPEAGNVGDDDLVVGPLLISDAGDGDDLFDPEVGQCARGAQR